MLETADQEVTHDDITLMSCGLSPEVRDGQIADRGYMVETGKVVVNGDAGEGRTRWSS